MCKHKTALSLFSFLIFSATLVAADTYTVDAVHSSVLFRSKRFDVVNVYGRFNDLQGTVVFDSERPERSSVQLEIKSASVDTNNQRRDDHLRSPDFFNATQFPVITFKSTGVRKLSDKRFEVTGDLNLHGVTRPVTAQVDLVGTGQDPRRGTPLIGFESHISLKRSDFGMNFMLGPLSDEIELIIAIHGMGQ